MSGMCKTNIRGVLRMNKEEKEYFIEAIKSNNAARKEISEHECEIYDDNSIILLQILGELKRNNDLLECVKVDVRDFFNIMLENNLK